MDIKLKQLGDQHYDIAVGYVNLQNLALQRKQYKEGLEYARKAWDIYVVSVRPSVHHPNSSPSYVGKGTSSKPQFSAVVKNVGTPRFVVHYQSPLVSVARMTSE